MARGSPTRLQRVQRFASIARFHPGVLVGWGLVTVIIVVFVVQQAVVDGSFASLLIRAAVALALVTGVLLLLTNDAAAVFPGCPIGGDHTLLTRRVRIRPPEPSDADAYAATIDGSVRSEHGWDAATERQMVEIVRSKMHLARDTGHFLIEERDGRIIGHVSVHLDNGGGYQLGWWIGPEARGQGFATEAITAMIERLHSEGVVVVMFGTALANSANRRIAAKVGAEQVALRPHTLPNGQVVDSVWYVHTSESAIPDGTH